MNYLPEMAKVNWKAVLWENVKERMVSLYGGENLTRLIAESGVGNGTVTRVKKQETSVGLEVLENLAAALKVEPWQLIHPTLGKQDRDEATTSRRHAEYTMAAGLLHEFNSLPDDMSIRGEAHFQAIQAIKAVRNSAQIQQTPAPAPIQTVNTSSE